MHKNYDSVLPGYAITVHKSQGMNIGKNIVNLGPVEFCSGLTYTGLSRSRISKDLAIDPFPDLQRFMIMAKAEGFLAKLKEDERILLHELATLESG